MSTCAWAQSATMTTMMIEMIGWGVTGCTSRSATGPSVGAGGSLQPAGDLHDRALKVNVDHTPPTAATGDATT